MDLVLLIWLTGHIYTENNDILGENDREADIKNRSEHKPL